MKSFLYGPLLLAATLLPATPANAMTWEELQTEILAVESGAPGNREMILRFSEMVHMLVSYTRDLQTRGLATPFCPPRGQTVTIDELVSLVRVQARAESASPETLVQDLLLAGYRHRFPCP